MKQLKGVILLFLIFVGCVPFISVPGQLYDVYRASDATLLKVEYISFRIYTVRVGTINNKGSECRYEFEFKILNNGELVKVKDVIPGDFRDCHNAKKLARVYSKGEVTKIYLASNGYYFLKQGSFFRAITPLLVSLLVFAFLYFVAKNNTRSLLKRST